MEPNIVIQSPPERIKRDPILADRRYRMKVRVNVHSTSVYQADVLTHLLRRGDHEVIAYESQVPSILAKVETRQDMIEHAKEMVRRKRRDAMADVMGQGNQFGWQEIDPLDYDLPKYPELRKKSRDSTFGAYGVTVDSEFRSMMGRSILPLSFAEKGDALEPIQSQEEQRDAFNAGVIAREISKTIGAGNGNDRVAALMLKLEEQQSQIEALKKMVGDALAAPPAGKRDKA